MTETPKVSEQRGLDAQMAVLGSLLLDDSCAGEVFLRLNESHFSGEYKTIFRAAKKLYQEQKPIDPVMVKNILGNAYTDLLLQLMELTPTAANVMAYVDLAVEQAKVNQFQALGMELAACQTSEAALEVLERLNKITAETLRFEVVSAQEGYIQALRRVDEPADYVNWGMEKISGGVMARKGDYVCIGARPSAGKTALTLQMAWEQSELVRVGYFSFETDPDEIFDRLMALVAGVDSGRLRRKTVEELERNRMIAAGANFNGRHLDVIHAAGMTVSDVRAMTVAKGYQIVYVDYLQIVRPERGWRGNRYEVVTSLSMDLHAMAKQLGVLVVATTQLRRPPDGNEYKPPTLADLRESGQIEQDADVAMLLYKRKSDWPTPPRDLLIAKNKKGQAGGYITLAFNGPTQRFQEIDGEKLEECTPNCITHGDKVSPAGLTGKQDLPF